MFLPFVFKKKKLILPLTSHPIIAHIGNGFIGVTMLV